MQKPYALELEAVDDLNVELASIAQVGDRLALAKLEEASASKPGWPDLRLQLARRYYLAGKHEECRRELDAALAINPSFFEALKLKARLLTDRGELAEGIAICQRLSALDPCDVDSLVSLASLQARLGDHASAIGAARNAVTLDNRRFDALVVLAEQYLCLGDFQLARRYFETAYRCEPNAEIGYVLGLIALKLEDPSLAEDWFHRALSCNPTHFNATVRLVRLKIHEGDYPAAYDLLFQAVANYPRYPDLQYGLARVCLLMGRADEAHRLMEAAVELNPSYATARRDIGSMRSSRDMDEAANQTERSLESEPNDEQAINNLAWIYDRKGEHERALDLLQHATERSPDSWRLLQTLGVLQLKHKAYGKAKLAFDAAASINPDVESTERVFRVAYRDEPLLREEKERLEDLYSDPKDAPLMQHHLGRLHLEFHDLQMAAQYFRQSLAAGCLPNENTILLAIVESDRADYVKAIRLLENLSVEGIALNVRQLLLGLMYANTGEHETSTRYYQQLMNDAPLLIRALDGLGVCFREREEIEDMLDDYLDYARHQSRNAPLVRRIGLAYGNKGMLTESCRQFEHAMTLDEHDGHAVYSLGLLSLLRLDLSQANRQFKLAADREPQWALPRLARALTLLAKGETFEAMLDLQRYMLLETTQCWHELAADLNRKLNDRAGIMSSTGR